MRLSRPHPSGGRVIERAAVLAAGSNAAAMLTWISDHAQAEDLAPPADAHGIHGARATTVAHADVRKPLRYVVSAAELATLSGEVDG